MVAKVDQRIQQTAIAARLLWAEHPGPHLGQRLAQLLILVVVITRLITVAAQRLDLCSGITEDKDIVLTHVLQHLNVGAVQRANGQRTVEGELHITGPGGFSPCQRHLRQTDAVVGNEHHL